MRSPRCNTEGIVVIGGGGHAKVVISTLKKLNWAIAGYTDTRDRGTLLGVQYIGNDSVLVRLKETPGRHSAIVGVGKTDSSSRRMDLQNELSRLGFAFPIVVSPQAILNEEVMLGPGTLVCDGAVINSGTTIGSACIVNTNSTVEHDCWIADNVHVAPGVTLSGGVTIGDNCMIGAGSTVIEGVTISASSTIGAGSTVTRDIGSPGTYVGSPARRIA